VDERVITGKVVVNALLNNDQSRFTYPRPVKGVALDPDYGRKGTRQLVAGGAQGQLNMSEKGWFGNKDVVLHAGEGTIHAVKWRSAFIAWANDTVRCVAIHTHIHIHTHTLSLCVNAGAFAWVCVYVC
jgi:vacuolar protein sorting-associated protein 41